MMPPRMPPEQSEILNELRKARNAALDDFQDHTADCSACAAGLVRTEPDQRCAEGQRLESNVSAAWAALEKAASA